MKPTEAKHTPGPWRVFDNPEGLPIIESQHGAIAHIRMHQSASGPEVDVNALLIAAAPELLEALKDARVIIAATSVEKRNPAIVAAIDAAIAKAEGAK